MITWNSTLAGFTLNFNPGFLSPLTVDGGQKLSVTAANSIGIIYPGERADILLAEDNLRSNTGRLRLSLDPEYGSFQKP
jgi:hypothetical protein